MKLRTAQKQTVILSVFSLATIAALAIAPGARGVLHATQGGGFTAIVGNWSNSNDGGPAFGVDATGWSGQTEQAALEALSKSLFPAPNDTFVTNGTSRQAFPIAVFNEAKNVTTGTLRVQFKLVGGTSDRTAGIVFNMKPNGEYFFARYNTLEGNVAIWRYRNGARARVAAGTATVQLPLNAWHDLSVTIAGDKVTAAVNGDALKVEHTMTEPVSGRVGLWTKRDAITVFRSFGVTQ